MPSNSPECTKIHVTSKIFLRAYPQDDLKMTFTFSYHCILLAKKGSIFCEISKYPLKLKFHPLFYPSENIAKHLVCYKGYKYYTFYDG